MLGVGRLTEGTDSGLMLLPVHPAIAEADFFQAGDFKTLVVLNRADELGGFEQ